MPPGRSGAARASVHVGAVGAVAAAGRV